MGTFINSNIFKFRFIVIRRTVVLHRKKFNGNEFIEANLLLKYAQGILRNVYFLLVIYLFSTLLISWLAICSIIL